MKRTVSVALALALVAGFVSIASAANRSEETRQALYDLMNRFQATGRASVANQVERVRLALDVMTPEQLDVLARAYGDALVVKAGPTANLGVLVPRVDPVYSAECGSARSTAAALQAQLDTWQDLQAAAAVAQGECDAAADPATACPPAATAHDAALAAQFAYENSLLCNADIDSAEINAILDTVNGLEESVPSLEEIQAALDELEGDIRDALEDRTNELKAAIAELAAGQEEIKDQLDEVQDQLEEIKQLLLTPQGRRPGWNGRPGGNDQSSGNGNGNGNGNGH